MMMAIMAVYLVLLFAMVRLGIVAFNLFWKASPFIVLLLLSFGLFIPMGWGAPHRGLPWSCGMRSRSFRALPGR
jgi:hypothetical protein